MCYPGSGPKMLAISLHYNDKDFRDPTEAGQMGAQAARLTRTDGAKRFRIILIKPSHYDDDGYVIRWWRSMMPSNSLASVYGLAMDSIGRGVLDAEGAVDV